MQLHPFQVEGVNWIAENIKKGGVLLADDMGLGKTVQAIEVGRTLGAQRVLACVPALARETWARELSVAGLPHVLGLPRNDKRWEAGWEAAPTSPWIVVSYELLEEWWARAYKKDNKLTPPDLIICDEAHMLKGRNTRGKMSIRAGLVRDLSIMVPWRLLLTGTPLADRPRDLYNLLTIMAGGTRKWGSPWSFDTRYCDGHRGEHGWENKGVSNAGELQTRLREVMLRREKRDVAIQLPSLTRQVIWLDPDAAGTSAFRLALTSHSSRTASDALIATLEAKIPAAVEIALSSGRFLLLTWLKEHAKTMTHLIEKGGGRAFTVTGEMSTDQRERCISAAASTGAGIVATLDSVWQSMDSLKQVASIGIMHALRHQWMMMAQGEARLHRLGQKDPVQWLYLACRETMDALVIRNIVEKMDAYRAIVPSSEEATSMRDTLQGTEVSMADLYAGLE